MHERKLKKKAAKMLSLSVFFLGLNIPAFAASTSDGSHNRHLIGAFLGATSFEQGDDRKTEATYGIEYEFRFNPHLSVGAAYETSPDAHYGDGIDVQIIGLYYRPDSHWRFGVAIGEEKVGGDHPYDEPLKRIGVAYDFHFGSFGIAPTVNVDFVDGHKAYVAGVVFAKSF